MDNCVWCEVLCQECLDNWPKCAIGPCQNKCCLRLNSKYCWPHTKGSGDEAAQSLVAELETAESAAHGGDSK